MTRWLGWCVVLAACSSPSTERPAPALAPDPAAALTGAIPVAPPAITEPRLPISTSAFIIATARGELRVGALGVTALTAGEPVIERSLATLLDERTGRPAAMATATTWTLVAVPADDGPVDAVLLADATADLPDLIGELGELRGRRIAIAVRTPERVERLSYVLSVVPASDWPRAPLAIDAVNVTALDDTLLPRLAVRWSGVPVGFGALVDVAARGMPVGREVVIEAAAGTRVEHLVILLEAARSVAMPGLELRLPIRSTLRGWVTRGPSLLVEIEMADDDPHQDDRAIARRFIRRESGKLSMCYEARAQGDASFNAGIGLSVELSPAGGAPSSVKVTKGDAQIAACTRAVIASILFPAAKTGAVTLPVQLLFRQPQY